MSNNIIKNVFVQDIICHLRGEGASNKIGGLLLPIPLARAPPTEKS